MARHLGYELLCELRRRGEIGMYFDYAGYRALRQADSLQALQDFLDRNGYADVWATDDASRLADELRSIDGEQRRRASLGWTLLMFPFNPIGSTIEFCGLLSLWLFRKPTR